MCIRNRIQLGVSVLVVLLIAGCSRVADDWRAAQAADTPESYQQFLQQHSGSEFGAQAQERIKQLAENRDWQGASSADTRDAYEQFLAQHMDSKWAQEARVRIENFQLASGATATSSAGSDVSAPPEPRAAELGRSPGTKPAVGQSAAAKPATAASAPASAKAGASKQAPARVSAQSAEVAAGTVYAQLGAFSSRARAEAEWQKLHASVTDLAALKPRYSVGKNGADNVYRLQVGVQSRQQALSLCASLKKRSLACIPASG